VAGAGRRRALPRRLGVLELVYLALLARAYTSGEVGVVYPIARATAPVLVLVVTGLFLSAAVSAGQAVGVVLVSAGVALLHRTGRRTGPRDTTFGLAIGCCIAGYTIVDAHGLDHAAPLAYLEIVVGVPAILYASGMARARGLPALRAELGPATAAAGLALFVSYGLVLLALGAGRAGRGRARVQRAAHGAARRGDAARAALRVADRRRGRRHVRDRRRGPRVRAALGASPLAGWG
jgi:multidrug transporter EmrE-like cation transporter